MCPRTVDGLVHLEAFLDIERLLSDRVYGFAYTVECYCTGALGVVSMLGGCLDFVSLASPGS